MKHFFLIVAMVLCITKNNLAQSSSFGIWKDISVRSIPEAKERYILPKVFRILRLDKIQLQRQLSLAPIENINGKNISSLVLELPLPNGGFGRFYIIESPIIERPLLEKYPELRTYAGYGIDDPSAVVRLDFLPNGFHAMIRSNSGVIFIDPYSHGDTENYISYDVRNHKTNKNYVCQVTERLVEEMSNNGTMEKRSSDPVGDQLKILRIAIASTGEYATFHGGTTSSTLAAIVTTLNRVNVVYETEVSTRMILIGGNDQIIYTNSTTDPYTNDDLNAILAENQLNIDNVIGSANYDLGHVFGTKGGGLAGIDVICSNSNKAWGATGISSPIGDFFDVVYVCHEIGHQFGAPHTFNSCSNSGGGGSTAYEPGSGTTIMAYAGLCGSDNIQFETDYFFHSGSYDRIKNGGNNCATYQATGNTPPSVQVVSPSGLTIPKSTPFTLEGAGSDTDGDAVVFSWDEMDLGPVSPLGSPTGTSPLFRYRPPIIDPVRTFPQISDIVNNTSDPSEVLSNYGREINFRITVRDQKLGGGGVDYADYKLSVSGSAGPFLILEPNTAVSWFVGDTKIVSWDVANTDVAPVNCSNVDILLSTDGGYTYPVTVASNVPNTGSATITVPDNVGNQNRIKIACTNSVFFDISNTNFTIEKTATPTFTMLINPISQSICGTQDVSYSLELTSLQGFNESVNLTASGLPEGAVANFNPNSVTPSQTVQMTLSNLANANTGSYVITIEGSSTSQLVSTLVELDLYSTTPEGEAVGTAPLNGARGEELDALISWENTPNTTSYEIEIATNPSFGSHIVESATVNTNFYTPSNLDYLTVFYWRVRPVNTCGTGSNSATYQYQTVQQNCSIYNSSDVPKTISEVGSNIIVSTVEIPDDHIITDLNIPNINGTHNYVSDLIIALENPSGLRDTLFDKICNDAKDFNLGFDDEASTSTINCPPTNGVIYRPATNLSIFDGSRSIGTWNLIVSDIYNQDGGSLDAWSVEICYNALPIPQPSIFNNKALVVNSGQSGNITNNLLQINHSGSNNTQIVYTLEKMPSNGLMYLDGLALSLGESFTQDDINNNKVYYSHNGGTETSDQFNFSVLVNGGGWLPNADFHITIQQGEALVVDGNIDITLDCHNATNAQISVSVSGGSDPYMYSSDGNNFQSSNIFTGLSSGIYTISVRDAINNTASSLPIEIQNPLPIQLMASSNDRQITVDASGGTGTFQYKLNGQSFQSSNVFNNLDGGNHTVTVQDENGCESTISVTVIPVLAASLEIVETIKCSKGENGKIQVSASGGMGQYVYSMDGDSFQQANIFDNLTTGHYSVIVRDENGNTVTTNEVDLADPSMLSISATVIEETITVHASGGTGSLQYSINEGNFQSENVFDNLSNGEYTLSVKDSNGCTKTTTATISVNTLVVSLEIEKPLSCNDGNDGKIKAEVNGGKLPYEYSLDGEIFQSSNSFNNLSGGTYTVVVRDLDGFTRVTNEVSLDNPTILSANANVEGNTITITASGGTGNLQYSLDGINFQVENVFDNLLNDTYELYIKDANECFITTSAIVKVNTIIAEAVLIQHLSCNDSNDGMIKAEVSNGTSPFQYSLDGGETYQLSNVFSGLSSGMHKIMVKDSEGFTRETNGVEIDNPGIIIISIEIVDNNITVMATGGTEPFIYSVNGENFQNSNVFNGLNQGDYIVTVKDKNKCRALGLASIIASGVEHIDEKWKINVFPNPSSQKFGLQLNRPEAGPITISVWDMKGRLLIVRKLNGVEKDFTERIDLSRFSNGVYQLQLSDGIHFFTKRLMLIK